MAELASIATVPLPPGMGDGNTPGARFQPPCPWTVPGIGPAGRPGKTLGRLPHQGRGPELNLIPIRIHEIQVLPALRTLDLSSSEQPTCHQTPPHPFQVVDPPVEERRAVATVIEVE